MLNPTTFVLPIFFLYLSGGVYAMDAAELTTKAISRAEAVMATSAPQGLSTPSADALSASATNSPSAPLASSDQLFAPATPDGVIEIKETGGLLGFATELSTLLGEVAGEGKVRITNGGAKASITLALASDSELSPSENEPLARLGPQGYLIRSTPRRIVVAGNSVKAVEFGVFKLLYHFGYRWLRPGDDWIVRPSVARLGVGRLNPSTLIATEPSFISRSLFYEWGEEAKNATDTALWKKANLLEGANVDPVSGLDRSLVCNHVYESFLLDTNLRPIFREHPEYMAMTEAGSRVPYEVADAAGRLVVNPRAQLATCNPGVADLLAEFLSRSLSALRKKFPSLTNVSAEPNDGAVDSMDCRYLGGYSDQLMSLTNKVAEKLAEKVSGASVCLLAYSRHAAPPRAVRPAENVYVEVTTAFNQSGLPFDDQMKAWNAILAPRRLGVYDYLDVILWSFGLPGRAPISREGAFDRFEKFYDNGARFYTSQFNANWGASGPYLYVAAQRLWDVHADRDYYYSDYFISAYGAAAPEMKRLYESFQNSDNEMNPARIYEWMRLLDAATVRAASETPAVNRRLAEMRAYVHFLVLYFRWNTVLVRGASVDASHMDGVYAAYFDLFNFLWRTKERQFVHMRALADQTEWKRMAPIRAGYFARAPGPGYDYSTVKWKFGAPLSDMEIDKLYSEDKLLYRDGDPRAVRFSGELEPAGFSSGSESMMVRLGCGLGCNGASIYGHFRTKGGPLSLKMAASGRTVAENTGGSYKLDIWDERTSALVFERVLSSSPTDPPLTIPLSLPGGQYRVRVAVGKQMFEASFIGAGVLGTVFEASPLRPGRMNYGGGYFYVPRGVKEVKLSAHYLVVKAPSDKTPQGRIIKASDMDADGVYSVPVAEGDDGRCWTIVSSIGPLTLFNVPPYIARDPSEFILPTGTF